jgi:hypothetical protein
MENLKNNAPLIEDGKKLTRKFLGELFPKNGQDKKELQAYLKGHENFYYKGKGVRVTLHGEPMLKVRQQYFYI